MEFRPLLKLYDKLLVIGYLNAEDIKRTLILLFPRYFDDNYKPGDMDNMIAKSRLNFLIL